MKALKIAAKKFPSINTFKIRRKSHCSYQEESYQPYTKELAAYVRTLCPGAKKLMHQTWVATDIQADGVIPSGQAFLYAQQHVEKIHRDTFHASLGLGRFILALVWYKYLTGNDISQVSFHDFDEEVSEQEYQVALEAVKHAFE